MGIVLEKVIGIVILKWIIVLNHLWLFIYGNPHSDILTCF